MPGQNRISFDVQSHLVNSGESRNHWPVPSCLLAMKSDCLAGKSVEDSHSKILSLSALFAASNVCLPIFSISSILLSILWFVVKIIALTNRCSSSKSFASFSNEALIFSSVPKKSTAVYFLHLPILIVFSERARISSKHPRIWTVFVFRGGLIPSLQYSSRRTVKSPSLS